MNELPSLKIEPPIKYLKHVEKLDTSVFPDCYSIERSWHVRKGFTVQKNLLYVHHYPDCKWSVLRIRIEKEEVVTEEL